MSKFLINVETGNIIDEDGRNYDFDDYLFEQLGFCGCGHCFQAASYLMDALALLAEKCYGDDYEEWFNKANEFFNNNKGLQTLVWYIIDNAGLSDHGGSVPGWISPEGTAILELYKVCKENESSN